MRHTLVLVIDHATLVIVTSMHTAALDHSVLTAEVHIHYNVVQWGKLIVSLLYLLLVYLLLYLLMWYFAVHVVVVLFVVPVLWYFAVHVVVVLFVVPVFVVLCCTIQTGPFSEISCRIGRIIRYVAKTDSK